MNSTTGINVEQFGSSATASHAETGWDSCQERQQPIGAGQGLQNGSQARNDEGCTPLGDAFAICQALGLTRSELVSMSVRQLNIRVRTAHLDGQQTRALKHLRRMLKNRGYAAICRTRRVEQRGYLEEQKETIRAHIEALEAENDEIAADIARVRRDFTGLLAWCIEHRMLTVEEIQFFEGLRREFE
ncbi:uncharacterized protein LOC119164951 [Rhipicephalus microplus]|uniref:uncharacterized protein LOC119164951 n=1 Tax=Rhipicephalus microplus TaxID=6941 RepID=UPI003F6C2F68